MQIELDKNTALVIFELLASREEELVRALALDDPERNALWHLECALERVLVEPFSAQYSELLEAAREALRAGGA